MAVARYSFFGREVISFLVILPIALPGIVTGLALQATIVDVLGPLGITFGLSTIIIGHATFCVVVVYNNVIARMRRTAGSLDEASADLGADSWQTFRYVTFPQMRTALLAGGAARVRALVRRGRRHDLHRRARSRRSRSGSSRSSRGPRELPIVNVVALFVIVVSIIPVWIAQRLAGRSGLTGERPEQGAVAAAIEAEP